MKLLIVDDHALFREGLKLLLAKIDAHTCVVDAEDFDSAVRAAQEHPDIDLALLDLALPGPSGMEMLSEFRRLNDRLPVVVLSGSADPHTVLQAIELGAMGFIPKTASPGILDGALKIVMAGGIYVPPTALQLSGAAPSAKRPSLAHWSDLGLTQRQWQVFKLIVQGRPNKLIARDLGVAESTIKAHVKPILKALNVTSRVGAILEVARLGISLG